MKILFLALSLVVGSVGLLSAAEEAAPAPPPPPTLVFGSSVQVAPITAAKWIQGGPLTEFEPGKIYVIECWATWCGPCIKAIPHVEELHRKYSDKGLRVVGLSVFEDDAEKVEMFVKSKGEGMTYPVAFTGMGSPFEKEWLVKAGVNGIPHTFVVKDGKIILMTNPVQLKDEIVESLLSGEEGIRLATEKIAAENKEIEKMRAMMAEFDIAASKGDVAVMKTNLAYFEAADPKDEGLNMLRLRLAMAEKRWDEVKNVIRSVDEPTRDVIAAELVSRVVIESELEFPTDFLAVLRDAYVARLGRMAQPPVLGQVILASLQWNTDEKEAALASAKGALAAASKLSSEPLSLDPYERFVKSLEGGTLPRGREVMGWMREVKAKQARAKAAAAGGTAGEKK